MKRSKCVISYTKCFIKQFIGIFKKFGEDLKMAYFTFSNCHFEII